MLYFENFITRRDALRRVTTGLSGLALAGLGNQVWAASPSPGLTALREGVLIAGHAADKRLWVSDNRGHLLASDDGGKLWRLLTPQAHGAITAIAVREKLGVAVGHRGSVLTSSDAGQTWRAVSLPATEPVTLLDVAVLPNGRILAVGAFGACWQSDDAGASWKAMQPIAGDRHYNACAVNKHGVAVIAGEGGLLLRSADGGQSWSEVASPVKSSLFSVAATPAGHFVACGLGGAVLHSTDGGMQWVSTPTPDKHSWFGASMLDDNRVLLAGNGGALSSLAFDANGGPRVARHTREGYGAWSVVLSSGQTGGFLLAVGETGLKSLDRSTWMAADGGAAL